MGLSVHPHAFTLRSHTVYVRWNVAVNHWSQLFKSLISNKNFPNYEFRKTLLTIHDVPSKEKHEINL
jgi:hypothetical protein